MTTQDPKTYLLREGRIGFWVLLLVCQLAYSQTPSILPIGTLGGSSSTPYGVNALGQVVGSSFIDGNAAEHAFLFSSGAMTDLNTLGGSYSVGFDINKPGQVVGYCTVPDNYAYHAFLYSGGAMLDLGTLGGPFATAQKINNSGVVIGNSYTAQYDFHAFVYAQGQMTDLGTLGGSYASVSAVNAAGAVAGESSLANWETHACLWQNGGIADLGTLGGTYSSANAINDSGWVAGYSYTSGDREMHGFVYDGASLRDLGTFGGGMSVGYCINNLGQVAGDSYTADRANHAFVYANGNMLDLGSLGGSYSSVYDLNNSGQIVGESLNAGGETKAFLWENGSMTALEALLPAGSGWNLQSAYKISDGGHILGYGLFNGQFSWFLLSLNRPQNHAPQAEAGAAQVVECRGSQTTVTLDGTGSTDSDGDALGFEWSYQNQLLSTNAVVSVAFGLGAYQVSLKVTDPSGASSQDSVLITVVDTTPPTLACPAPLSLPAYDQCQAAIPDFLANLAAADNCTPASSLVKRQSPPAGTWVGLGPHLVQITVTDASGNVSACATTVTVQDVTPPALACPAPLSLAAYDQCQAAIPDFLANLVAADNCTPASLLVKTQNPPAGTLAGLGPRLVQITVADASGNVSRCATTVTVQDTTPPVIQSITATPAALFPPDRKMVPVTLTVLAEDNCDPSPLSQITSITSSDPATGPGDNTSPDWEITGPLTANLRAEGKNSGPGRVYTLTIQCTDAAGNSSTAAADVTVGTKSNPGKPPKKLK